MNLWVLAYSDPQSISLARFCLHACCSIRYGWVGDIEMITNQISPSS